MTDVDTSKDSSTSTPGVSRRQLVKTGVWAAPVVLLTTAAPAAAALTTPPAPNGTIEVTDVTVDGTGPWTISVTVKNNATNAADAAVGSVLLTTSNGVIVAGPNSASFSLAPGAQTTLTNIASITRDTATTGAVSVTATPSAGGYTAAPGKQATVAPALGSVTVAINGSGSTFTVSAYNPAGNPTATVVVALTAQAFGNSVSAALTGTTTGANWAWDSGSGTATLTVAAGTTVATGTVVTASGLGGSNKYVTVSPNGPVGFAGQAFPSTGPTAATLGRP